MDARVVWDQFRHGSDAVSRIGAVDSTAFTFSAHDYEAAVLGRSMPTRWEPTARRACEVAKRWRRNVDLDAVHLRSVGFGHRGDDEVIVHAFTDGRGGGTRWHLRSALRLTDEESAGDVARRMLAYTSGDILCDPQVEQRTLARR
jgi:hypothetical protein